MSLILDRVVSVKRLLADTDNTDKEQYQAFAPLANVAINIQPAGAEDSIIADGTFGQAYIAFTTVSGIRSGDKLTDQVTGETFIVKGLTNWMSTSLIPHIELLLTEFETAE